MNTWRIRFRKSVVNALRDRVRKAFESGDAQMARRTMALLVIGESRSIQEAAQLLGVSVQTMYNWLKAFLFKGMASLVYKVSSGRKPKLTKKQKRELVSMIKAGPLAAGYETACWSSLLVQHLIHQRFGILYNRHYVFQLLHNLRISFQKARFVSDHLDPEKRKRWREQTWPEILKLAEQHEAMILFEDEASFAQWGSLGYTWAPVGEQPEVKTTGIRKGYKIFGAIEYFSGVFYYQGIRERFNSESYVLFLRHLINKTSKHIILIHDGAKYHKSKETRKFLEAHKGRLTIYLLPSYSPDYNPIEFLWKKMKARATHNKYFPDFEDLVGSVDTAMTYFACHSEEIRCLMGLYVDTLGEESDAA